MHGVLMRAKISGFVYIWYDKTNKMYYVGSHWGHEDDGYICSSNWMKRAYKNRPADFKRRIAIRISTSRLDLLKEEQRWLQMIKDIEILPNTKKPRYYNLNNKSADYLWHAYENQRLTVGQKISKTNTGRCLHRNTPERADAISRGKKAAFERSLAENGYKFSPEHVANMTAAITGRKMPEGFSEAQAERLKEQWATGKRQSKPWGSHSEETKQKMSAVHSGKLVSQDTREKISMSQESGLAAKHANFMKNKWADPVWKENQRKALTGKTGPKKEWRVVSPTGEVFEPIKGLRAFCREHNIPSTLNTGKAKGWTAVKIQ
jgi:NUMOD3 motif